MKELYETQPACPVEIGETVCGMPYLNSCCLILVRTRHGIMAQHWPGTDPDLLDDDLFPDIPTEILMVTGRESDYQKRQAQVLQLDHPSCLLHYYAYNTDRFPTPVVKVTEKAFELLNSESYHPVAY